MLEMLFIMAGIAVIACLAVIVAAELAIARHNH